MTTLTAPASARRTPAAERIVAIDPWQDQRYERFLAGHPGALVYQHPAWLAVLREVYGYRPLVLAAEDAGGGLRGVLPLMRRHGLVSGPVLSSLPHTPVAGPLAADDETAAALVWGAVARVQAAGMQLQLKSVSAAFAPRVEGLVAAPWRASYALRLPADPAALRFGNSRNHARIKWAAGKAAREGVAVRAAEREADLRAWYPLYLDTLRRHGVPPHPYRLFRAMWQRMRPHGMVRLMLAERHTDGGRRVLAGSMLLGFGGTLFYAFNGVRRDSLSLRPNDAIHWHAIHDACRAGYRRYDFGEVVEHSQGLAEFKGKWGTEQEMLHRCYYPVPREVESGALDQDRGLRHLATAAWQRAPLPITARLGFYLYRYL